MEHAAVGGLACNHVVNPDMLGVCAEHAPGIGHVKAGFIGAEGKAIGAGHIRDHQGDITCRINAVDAAGQVLRGFEPFVICHDAVMRIGEPDAAIAAYDHIIRAVQGLAIIAVGNHGDAAIPFRARHTPLPMFTADKPPLPISRMAVGIV